MFMIVVHTTDKLVIYPSDKYASRREAIDAVMRMAKTSRIALALIHPVEC